MLGECGTNMAMTRPSVRKTRPPLDANRLDELALTYVGRFATSRAKLASYLRRKLRERGWAGDKPPDVEGLVERLSGLGYVNDQAYALAKARSLAGRGYGERRVGQALSAAGIGEEDAAEARDYASAEAVESAVRFARRRRFGPFGDTVDIDPRLRERHLAAMVRAGHSFRLAKSILQMEPGSDPDWGSLTKS